ncbi:MAG: nucleotide exchange factor GrpE [Tannerellaceae bacterium]|nr:nucleotide exchange factor GrpE [Tannerellaceae bacterium]MCD8265397.1 nucleotide exchange factor GrpE [Tannerellaceae bacterium]
MSTNNFDQNKETAEKEAMIGNEEATNLQEENANTSAENDASDNVTEEENLEKKYNDLNDTYLRLMAEYDNYRKRTLREKAELIKIGGESALTNLLPVVDDFERALQTIRNAEDVKSVTEGVELIYSKFTSYLAQQGIKPIKVVGEPFDTEQFEAVAIIPAPEPELKGKVLDSVQTGYTLYDKVIRYAKVVVGE